MVFKNTVLLHTICGDVMPIYHFFIWNKFFILDKYTSFMFLSIKLCTGKFNAMKHTHTLQNISLVYVFPVESLLVFNTQTSQNIYASQYNVFWQNFIYKKFIWMFQKLNPTLLQNDVHENCACYSIWCNCLLTTILTVWWSASDIRILHPNIIVCYLYVSVLLCFSHVLGNWLGVLV
jgi:hypothetical protein